MNDNNDDMEINNIGTPPVSDDDVSDDSIWEQETAVLGTSPVSDDDISDDKKLVWTAWHEVIENGANEDQEQLMSTTVDRLKTTLKTLFASQVIQ
eukprot:9574252-Ditylum_brightwellii.AAC.1